ncbi:MAG: DUF2867 domain-containing protein [Bacteroidales bacterium]|nr:DUF2867 domain-containing protein [Candidatus Cacconaster merdequi]
MRIIDKYLPADYCDCVSRRIKKTESLSPDHIFEEMFCHFPKPVTWLFKLRNAIVKPFGLQGGGGFRNLISERNDEEIIISKNDKHLGFWVGIYCSPQEDGWQEASVTTVVKFNNFLGKIYFIGIWVFHKLLVKSLFRKAIKD